ncbi:TfuA-like protein [Actinoplanes oblitus]|uniref:TfuA-like protein n=1 Tax=Actinoplanes oblitus TaxID=3040509 RepID=A0ABY8WF47_9ACTN|nr:TfuA-like protein [Actinoplanes oblitus]WIM96430.1 TfuA-like protein [Actinoplanes oblitus]
MSADTVVFLGPSLDLGHARRILPDAEYLPPVRRGDIDALMVRPAPPRRVAIVDGCFLHALSISPKEINKAMLRGVAFFGSSSMGALRAVELCRWGMTGVGQVYDLYRTGAVEDEDEVAITFDPESLRPLCLPMVNFRIAVGELVARDLLSAGDGTALLETAKAEYFPDRTVGIVFRRLADRLGVEEAERIRRIWDEHAPDAKRDDAVQLLEILAGDRGDEGAE